MAVVQTLDGERTSSRPGLGSFLRRTRDAFAPFDARATLLPRPAARALVRRPGPDPLHVLLVGGGALAGVGLSRHDLGLPGRLADDVVRRTARGVQMQVVVEEDITSDASIERLRGMRLRRFDSVLVLLGAGAAEHRIPDASWRAAIEHLARMLDVEAAPATRLHVYDSSSAVALLSMTSAATRTAGRAARLTEVSEAVFEQTRRIRFDPLLPPVPLRGAGGGFSETAYQDWADLIAAQLHAEMTRATDHPGSDTPEAYRDGPQRAEEQADALRRLVASADPFDGAFRDGIRTLQRAFGVEGASIGLLDDDRLHPIATSARTLDVGAAAASALRAMALHHDHLTLVNDARQEHSDDAGTVASAGLRFWASQPVHSWDGYRIGAVCLFDSRPNALVASQLDLIEDMAGRVEQHLWSSSVRPWDQ